jgi:hypothetical protein
VSGTREVTRVKKKSSATGVIYTNPHWQHTALGYTAVIIHITITGVRRTLKKYYPALE